MKPTLIALAILTLVGCASTKPVSNIQTASQDERWARRFSREEKIQLLHERAMGLFQEAKQLTSREHLEKAREDYRFLQQEFRDTLATQRLKELEQYEQNVIAYYTNSAQEAIAKKQLADAAGYYKLLLRFDSSQTVATEFLTQHQAEIEKELQDIRAKGEMYLKKKQYVKAQKVYERLWLIAYTPDIDSTLSYINAMQAQQAKRRQQALKKALQSNTDSPAEIDREKIYAEARLAFERKDYLKAYSLFSIIEPSYRDTSLYLERCADKIEALQLSEETN